MGEKVSPRGLIVVALGLAAAGLALMTEMLGAHSSWLAFEPGPVVAMVGVGLINPVLSGLALNSVGNENSGLAAGANDTFRQAGIAIGVAGLGALLPAHPDNTIAFVDGLHHALIAATLVALISALMVARLLAPRAAKMPAASLEVSRISG